NPPQTDDPTQRTMQSMTYYLPLITVVFFKDLAAGVFIYYITTTIFQIIQQYFVMGWGQLPRWIPALASVPTPADREMREREKAAIVEAEHDMEEPEAVATPRRNGQGGGRRRGRRRCLAARTRCARRGTTPSSRRPHPPTPRSSHQAPMCSAICSP